MTPLYQRPPLKAARLFYERSTPKSNTGQKSFTATLRRACSCRDPLSHAVLGERHLHDGYDVVYISAEHVREVVEALRPIDPVWLRRRYDAIDEADYRHACDDADFAYTWGNFVDIQAFYTRTAAAAHAVILTTT